MYRLLINGVDWLIMGIDIPREPPSEDSPEYSNIPLRSSLSPPVIKRQQLHPCSMKNLIATIRKTDWHVPTESM